MYESATYGLRFLSKNYFLLVSLQTDLWCAFSGLQFQIVKNGEYNGIVAGITCWWKYGNSPPYHDVQIINHVRK
jgi:hypothetical protein